jgi:hypothetical protein
MNSLLTKYGNTIHYSKNHTSGMLIDSDNISKWGVINIKRAKILYQLNKSGINELQSSISQLSSSSSMAMPVLPSRNSILPKIHGSEMTYTVSQNPTETPKVWQQRKKLNEVRVRMLRALMKIGSLHEDIVKRVLYRLDEREKNSFPAANDQLTSSLNSDGYIDDRLLMMAKNVVSNKSEGGNNKGSYMKTVVLCMGLVGSGKSSTIYNILGLGRDNTHGTAVVGKEEFTSTSKTISFVERELYDVKWTFIDTPGMYASRSYKVTNQILLKKIKAVINRQNPDNYVYFDRLDYACRDKADFDVFKSISNVLGNRIFRNFIIALTHAGSSPPDGIKGPIGYENFIQQRQSMIQQSLRLAVPETTQGGNPTFCLVENLTHKECRSGNPPTLLQQRDFFLLPTGSCWLADILTLLVSYGSLKQGDIALRTLANKNKENSQRFLAGVFGQPKNPPLPYLLMQLMNHHTTRKVPDDERGIFSLRQIEEMEDGSLDKRKATVDRKELKMRKMEENRSSQIASNFFVMAPEPPLPLSFEHREIDLHRYRYLENRAGWLTRPQINHQANELEDEIEGVIAERSIMLRPMGECIGGLPCHCYAIMSKGKNSGSFHGEVELTAGMDFLPTYNHRLETTTLTVNFQTLTIAPTGESDMLYILRGETHTKTTFPPRQNYVIGILVSRMSQVGIQLEGPWAFGGKVEYRVRPSDGLKVVIGFGKGLTHFSQKMSTPHSNQEAKALRLEVKKKIKKSQAFTSQTFLGWFENTRIVQFTVAHQLNLTQETHCTTKFQYTNKGDTNCTFGTKITSHDKPELAVALSLPFLNYIITAYNKLFLPSNDK